MGVDCVGVHWRWRFRSDYRRHAHVGRSLFVRHCLGDGAGYPHHLPRVSCRLRRKYRQHEDQAPQAHCLTLVVNICILSTTWYIGDAIDAHRADGHQVTDEVIAQISPAHFEAINPYGTHTVDVAGILRRARLRPLRVPKR